MSIFFTRLVLPADKGYVTPEDWEGCWKIYTICTAADKRTSTTNVDLLLLGSADRNLAVKSYSTFLDKANTGLNLYDLYDEKQCHEAHTFKMNGKPEKIYRIWGSGDIRIYFIYLPNKNIVVLKTGPKRKDNLTKGEKAQLEVIAKQVLGCLETNEFSTRIVI